MVALLVGLLVSILLVTSVFADSGASTVASTISQMNQHVADAQAALARHDIASARQSGRALEESWKGVESTVAKSYPRAELQVDQALDAANAAVATTPLPPDTSARFERLGTSLTALSKEVKTGPEVTTSAQSTVSVGDEVRHLEQVNAALVAGNVRGARQEFLAFRDSWPLVESRVSVSAPAAYGRIEAQMTVVDAEFNAPAGDTALIRQHVSSMIDSLRPLAGATDHYGPFDAAITLLREGLEALLVIGALLAIVTRAGRPDLRWKVWAGSAAGIVASLVVAAFVQIVFSHLGGGVNRELLEGVTGLLAAAMLLYVSYWMHGQSQLTDWRKFLASRSGSALASGNTLALPLLAFFAVFREGGETVLMYAGMAAAISLRDMLLGIAIGLFCLGLVGVALFGFGLRLPLKHFFRVISILLYYLGFKFVGVGIHALQIAGVLPATGADFLPTFGFLGLFATWQTTLAQGVVLIAAVAATQLIAASQRSRESSTASPA
ncbi:MAG: FTR1 family iron permease [Chloroflexi bacterium]|nr:FTR1 family iron permease [Chloroflexota bacterium]